MNIRPASRADLPAIEKLLNAYDLPASDCAEHLGNFFVAEGGQGIAAVGGFENLSPVALVRSFAVTAEHSGRGLAELLFGEVRVNAIEQGMTELYLLTTTASDYFSRFGFTECDRSVVPEALKATRQFSELCPASAVVMKLNLANKCDKNNQGCE